MKIKLFNPPASSEVTNNGHLVNTIVFSAEVDNVSTYIHVLSDVIAQRWPECSDIVEAAKLHRNEIESVIQNNTNKNSFFQPAKQRTYYLYNGIF